MTEIRRVEVYAIGSVVIVLVLIGLWYSHDNEVRQEALLGEQKKETAAQIKQQHDQAAALAAQTTTLAKAQEQDQAARVQIVSSLSTLAGQLSNLQAAQAAKVQQVQQMDPVALAKQVAAELGSTAQYDPATGTLSGVKPQDITNMGVALTELDNCRQDQNNLTQQATQCKTLQDLDKQLIASQQATITALGQTQALKDKEYAEQLALLEKEVKVAKGTRASRVLRALKYFGIGVGAGIAVGGHI